MLLLLLLQQRTGRKYAARCDGVTLKIRNRMKVLKSIALIF